MEIRTEGSGTASEESGNQYIWIYNSVADVDTPDANADTPIVTGSGTTTLGAAP